MKRGQIENVQRCLMAIAQAYHNVGYVFPNGVLDNATKRAVKETQGLLGIKKSGELDDDTVKGIYSLARQLKGDASPWGMFAFEPHRVYAYGDKADAIAVAQIMINRIAAEYKNVPQVELNGRLDIQTANALSVLKRIFGTETGGQLDADTWKRLLLLYYGIRSDRT